MQQHPWALQGLEHHWLPVGSGFGAGNSRMYHSPVQGITRMHLVLSLCESIWGVCSSSVLTRSMAFCIFAWFLVVVQCVNFLVHQVCRLLWVCSQCMILCGEKYSGKILGCCCMVQPLVPGYHCPSLICKHTLNQGRRWSEGDPVIKSSGDPEVILLDHSSFRLVKHGARGGLPAWRLPMCSGPCSKGEMRDMELVREPHAES